MTIPTQEYGAAPTNVNEYLYDQDSPFSKARQAAWAYVNEYPLSDVEKVLMVDDLVRKAINRLYTVGDSKLWNPQPGPQELALDCPAFEIFYGGAQGGGKTDLLLGAALCRHRKSIFFRREYPQSKDARFRSRELLRSTGAKYNGTEHIWVDIPGDRTLEFGSVQHVDDKEKYRGRPHDAKLFDEITGFTEEQYMFLSGWTRTTIPGQRCRIICAGNPPSSREGEWVVRRWAAWLDRNYPNPAAPGEIRWFTMIEGVDTEVDDGEPFEYTNKQGITEKLFPRSRTFIPARLEDNPILEQTGYRATLQSLPEPLRSQALYGDFTVGIEDPRWQLLPTRWVDEAIKRWESHVRENGEVPDLTEMPLTMIGVDVARGGADETVLAARHGVFYPHVNAVSGRETPDGYAIVQLIESYLADYTGFEVDDDYDEDMLEMDNPNAVLPTHVPINIDVIGVGSSPFDLLHAKDYTVFPCNASEGSSETDDSGTLLMANKRAEMWWRFRLALDPVSGVGLMIPPDTRLRSDLTAPRWKVRGGRIYVETKEEIYDRIKRSPDRGDAVVMAYDETTVENYIVFPD